MILPPPQVVNIRNSPHEIYIGLGSPWGNPYANTMPRGQAIKAYEKRLRRFLEDPGWRVELKALAGKTIGCHCFPQPCHGDVIVKLFLELYGPEGTMVVGSPNALGTTVRGLGPESQFHRPVHRSSLRRVSVSDDRRLDLGSLWGGSGGNDGDTAVGSEVRGGRG